MSKITLKIPNSKGITLHANLELPANKKPDHYALFAHCFTCNSNFNAVRNISRALTSHGFAVLRFDFTGLGMSEGEFADSHFEANVSDLVDACAFMKENYEAPTLLIGHSLGGTAAIVAGSQLEDVKAIATIGSPSSTAHVQKRFSHVEEELEEKGETEVIIGRRPFKINADFVKNFEKDEVLEIVKKMRKKALLVMHSPLDKIVSSDHAHHLFTNAFHPKSFIGLDGADHLLTKGKDSLYVGNVIGSWASRFLPPKEKKALELEQEQLVAHLNVTEDKFTTSIQMNKHFLTADEPKSVGGNDFGPSPYELLLSGLAACTVMTLKLYAQRKKWDLQEVYVYANHAKKHIQDMDNGKTARLDHIFKRLVLVGDLTEEQRTRLLEIAERCPVHRTLQNDVVIESVLSSEE